MRLRGGAEAVPGCPAVVIPGGTTSSHRTGTPGKHKFRRNRTGTLSR